MRIFAGRAEGMGQPMPLSVLWNIQTAESRRLGPLLAVVAWLWMAICSFATSSLVLSECEDSMMSQQPCPRDLAFLGS
jgi:hypothetical protein